MRSTFIQCLIEQARIDDRIFVITPDLGFAVLEGYAKEFPDRFLNVGIAEQNAVGVAAGLALSGKLVYVYSIIPFVTMRCFEQVRVDVAYMNTNVRLVGVGAGLSYGPAGPTHHAIEDIAIMRALPNMTVCCPGDPKEVNVLTRYSFIHKGPMYIRLAKNGEKAIHSEDTTIVFGKAVKVIDGDDFVIFTTSNALEEGKLIIEELWREGKGGALISMPIIKPIDKECILSYIKMKIPIITLEEHSIIGGLGSAVAEIIAENGEGVPFKRIGLPDNFVHSIGGADYLRSLIGFQKKVKTFCNKCEKFEN